jgi:hypothetical protein
MYFKVAAKLYPENKQFDSSINEVFSSLRRHYERSFDDTAVKVCLTL